MQPDGAAMTQPASHTPPAASATLGGGCPRIAAAGCVPPRCTLASIAQIRRGWLPSNCLVDAGYQQPLQLAAPRCRLVALIKPQFEVAKHEVGKGGIVRDPALHRRVCDEVRDWLEAGGWQIQGIVESPITGTEGNVEYLVSALREG